MVRQCCFDILAELETHGNDIMTIEEVEDFVEILQAALQARHLSPCLPLEPLMGLDLEREGDDVLELPPTRKGRKRPLGRTPHIVLTEDILCLPQFEAAKRLGLPVSTLSKRWSKATDGERVWPYRKVSMLDKELAESQVSKAKRVKLQAERDDLLHPVRWN